MKSWLRTRRGSPESGSRSKRQPPSPYTHRPTHAWTESNDDGSYHENSCQNNGCQSSYVYPSDSMTTLTPPLENAADHSHVKDVQTPEQQLLNQFSNLISLKTSSGLARQHVLVSSEHYFRLALESYEQLKAAHYRASQEFSLAEWLHIHALLLYGRIQQVRKAAQVGSISPHNQVDLSKDVAVFAPVATALNAIGIVEDAESGIVYIPDAVFPSDSSNNALLGDRAHEYSTQEMQQILSGVLYDWQRSWHRVYEAREERRSRATKFSMVRSSSQLISAIREATESIAKIREQALSPALESEEIEANDSARRSVDRAQRADSRPSLDLAGREKELMQLFEEARNAKDYTLRPPCDRVYGLEVNATAMKSQPFSQRNRELYVDSASLQRTLEESEAAIDAKRRDSVASLQILKRPVRSMPCSQNLVRPPEPNSPLDSPDAVTSEATDTVVSTPEALASSHIADCDSASSVHTALDPEELEAQLRATSIEGSEPVAATDPASYIPTLDPKKQDSVAASRTNIAGTHLVRSLLDLSSVKDGRDSTAETKPELETKAGPADTGKARQPRFLVPPIRSARPSEVNASPPPRSAMRKPLRSREMPESPPESLVFSSPDLSPESANTQSSQSTWGSMQSLVKPRVKIGGSSSVDCFVNYDSQLWQDYDKFVTALREKNLARFGQLQQSHKGNYAWVLPVKVDHASDDRAPRILLPRASIPTADQALALILQTSHASPKLLDSWHHSAVARVDLKQLLAEYVKTAVAEL